MIGNLTHIMRILLAFIAMYIGTNCPLFGEKGKDFFWVFAMTMFTVAVVGILISIGEYHGFW